MKEEGPVDELAKLRDRRLYHLRAGKWRRRQVIESKALPLGSGVIQGEQGAPSRRVVRAQLLLESLVVAIECVAAVLVQEVRDHADHTRRIEDVNGRAVVRGRDANRGV